MCDINGHHSNNHISSKYQAVSAMVSGGSVQHSSLAERRISGRMDGHGRRQGKTTG